jgi:hypothetical protein
MPTLRRILKYAPAVVMGLLVVVWVVSLGLAPRIWVPIQRWGSAIALEEGSLAFYYLVVLDSSYMYERALIPLPWVMTPMLPLAIGPFISFRFRLWHYLAFTTLVAVELAYYLRWQE